MSAVVSAPKVLVTKRLPASVLDALSLACDVDLHAERIDLTPDGLKERVREKAGLICLMPDRIDRAVIDAGSELQVIANVAVGFDNIDVDYAASRGVVVTNTPDVLTEAVAECTWSLILAITRRTTEGDRLVRAGTWKGWEFDLMLGTQLRGKRLGIVGSGRIGRAVADRAAGFGMAVVFATRPGQPAGLRAPESTSLHEFVSLDELLVTSDVVSLHVPLTDTTRHLIDRRTLARMKRSAYLVNTSRGPVVDEAALAWALRERLIAGAALDVYEAEPTVHPDLLTLETVVLTPHLGSATRETRTAMAELAVRNVVKVLGGGPPLTPVSA